MKHTNHIKDDKGSKSFAIVGYTIMTIVTIICYNGGYRATRGREAEQIAESAPQFGSGSATRPREVGFASNGVSATTP